MPNVYTPPEIQMTIKDAPVPVESVSITREVSKRVATGGARSMTAATGKAVVRPRGGVTSTVPHPWGGSGDRAPTAGDRLTLSLGAAESALPMVTDGAVDISSGSFSSPNVSVDFVDSSDRLNRGVSIPARLSINRELTSLTAVVDQIARQCGYFCTPPLDLKQYGATAILSAPLTGHNRAEDGQLLAANNQAWTQAEWGPALTAAAATVSLADNVDYEISYMMVAGTTMTVRASAGGQVLFALKYKGNGAYAVSLSTADSWVDVRPRNGTKWATPEGCHPVTVYVRGDSSGGSTVWLWSPDSAPNPNDYWRGRWEMVAKTGATWRTAQNVIEWAGPAVGGIRIFKGQMFGEGVAPAADRFVPNMRFRLSGPLSSCPSVVTPAIYGRSARDTLAELAAAVCATVRVAPDGALEWTSAYWRSPNPRTLTSLDDLLDLSWESRLSDYPRRAVIEYENCSIYGGSVGKSNSQVLWMPNAIELAPGQTWTGVAAPGRDEDWIGTDDSLSWASTGSGSEFSSNASSLVVSTDRIDSGNLQISIKNPTSANATFYAPNGSPTPIIRGDYKIVWTPAMTSGNVVGPDSAGDYVHKAGRWVSDARVLSELKTFITSELAKRPAQIKSIEIVPDFALDVGDSVTIKDEHAAGVTISGVVRKMDLTVSNDEARQVIEVDVASVTPATVKPLGT